MPFKKKADLPKSVKNSLPSHGEDIYKEAFNSAWEQYKEPKDRQSGRSREETSHAVAWSAVKKNYQKIKEGQWRRKDDR